MSSEMTTFAMPATTELGRAFIAQPDSAGPHPAVLVLHEIMGLNNDIERIANRFADEGYVAFAPDFFGEGFKLGCIVTAARSVKRGAGPTFDRLAAAHEALSNQPDVDADRLRSHLDELDVVSDVVSYPNAGHSFMNHNRGAMAKIGAIGPMNVGHDADAADDSWERMLAFFETNLGAT
jgi:dienelactone hydrolase